MVRNTNWFLKKPYIGSDSDDFFIDFPEYLQGILDSQNWDAMSDHALFLQGAKQAIKEIREEILLLQEAAK